LKARSGLGFFEFVCFSLRLCGVMFLLQVGAEIARAGVPAPLGTVVWVESALPCYQTGMLFATGV
jgi:hypothetical protein